MKKYTKEYEWSVYTGEKGLGIDEYLYDSERNLILINERVVVINHTRSELGEQMRKRIIEFLRKDVES